MFVEESIVDAFTERFVAATEAIVIGDTADDAMSVSSEVSAVSARSEQSSRSRTNNKRGASSSAGCPSAKK